jgi:hypothetical protein
MMDAHVERTSAGEEGFLHDTSPKFELKPNRRLDRKAPLMEYERWNRDWARGSGDDPKGLAREYETYIRDLDKDHGHDPGLIFARDLTQQVEKYHGTGSDLAKQLVTLLADRPDLQRQRNRTAIRQDGGGASARHRARPTHLDARAPGTRVSQSVRSRAGDAGCAGG